MLQFLAGLVLFELSVIGAVFAFRDVFDLKTAAYWQRQAYADRFELESCANKHRILTNQIKKEGLWARLGMPGQPWLQ